jgi:hypothetical protein
MGRDPAQIPVAARKRRRLISFMTGNSSSVGLWMGQWEFQESGLPDLIGRNSCFRDRAARPAGRTTPPTDPDERNERIRFLEVVVSLHFGVDDTSRK